MEMLELAASPDAPDGVRAFVKLRTTKVPGWARALSPVFPELDRVLNMSNRLIIFLPVRDRTFALCFGYGSSVLEWSAVEPNFGLRYAARRLDPASLNEIRSRRIDASSRTQSVYLPSASDLQDFDVMLDGEFVRKLSGELDKEGISFGDLGVIVASDSVAFKYGTDLREVARILGSMLDEVDSREPHEELSFVDSLISLRSSSEEAKNLDDVLAVRLFGAGKNGMGDDVIESVESAGFQDYFLEFSPPDGVEVERVDKIYLYRGKAETQSKIEVGSLSLVGLRESLSGLKGRFGRGSLKSIKLMAFGHDGEPVSQMRPLKDWLVFETGKDGSRFILTLGRWFSLDEAYAEKLNADLAQIEEVADELNLPEWPQGENEGEYNKLAAKGPFVLLDKVDIRSSDGNQVEACDLLGKKGHLIHVKRYNGSQTLSHLFSQGFVSAQLLAGDAKYREEFIKKVIDRDPDFFAVAKDVPVIVTFAIGVSGNKRIPEDLPSFSKVNLRDFVKRLRSSRLKPTLCRVQISS